MRIKYKNETYQHLINKVNANLENGDYEVYEDGNEYRMTVNGLFLKMTKFGEAWMLKYYLPCGDRIELIVSAE